MRRRENRENVILCHDDYMKILKRLEVDAKGEEFIDGFYFKCLRNLVDAYGELLVDYNILEEHFRNIEHRLDQKINECLRLRKENKELRIEMECMFDDIHEK